MRSKAIATGLAVSMGLFANAAPATAASGGVDAEHSPQGGLAAQSNGHNSDTAAKLRYIKQHEKSGKPFYFMTLDPEAGDPDAKGAEVVVTGKGKEIVNPLTFFNQDGSEISAYVGRKGATGTEVIPAGQAHVTEYIGHTAITIDDPSEFLAPHTLRAVPYNPDAVVGFTAAGSDDGFGLMP